MKNRDTPEEAYIGESLGRGYRVDRLLGMGAFAWVYHATTPEGGEVAVKILRSEDPTAALRFARETRVLSGLPSSPHVAGYIDQGQTDDGRPLIVMEYVDGITLRDGMARATRLETKKAVAFMAELCGAFVGLHQLGVAHRDVKPENILLARAGGIKLIDFGLIRDAQGLLKLFEAESPLERRIFDQEVDHRILVGTPEYMAPEQFSDAAVKDVAAVRTDTWSDVFSLGVILYQLLSAKLPFPMTKVPANERARGLLEYMRWRTTLTDEDLEPCPGVDGALASILNKALRQDPRQRQRDAIALRRNLNRYLQTGRGIARWEEGRTEAVEVDDVIALKDASAPRRPPGGASVKKAFTSIHDVDTQIHGKPAPERGSSPFVHAETIPESPLPLERPAQETREEPLPKKPAEPTRRWIDAPTLAEPPLHLEASDEDALGVPFEDEIPTNVYDSPGLEAHTPFGDFDEELTNKQEDHLKGPGQGPDEKE